MIIKFSFRLIYPSSLVLSVTGGICGLLLVFIMPIACHLKYQVFIQIHLLTRQTKIFFLTFFSQSETISKAKFYASCGLHGGILLLGFTAGLGQFVYPWNYGNQ